MSVVRQRLSFASPTVEWGFIFALVLAQIDVFLTWRVAVHGPAVETGVGASQLIQAFGPSAWEITLLVGITVIFSIINHLSKIDPGWAKIATGYVFGFLIYNILTNMVIALKVGAI